MMPKITVNPVVAPAIVEEFDKALLILGIDSRNHAIAEMMRALALQMRSGQIVAWPPEFVCQDRSNAEYIAERKEFAREKHEGITQGAKRPKEKRGRG